MKHREQGFSTILIVLMTAIVLIGVFTTSATVVYASRQSGANELASLRATLASESAHEAFRSMAVVTPFRMGIPSCSGLLANSCYESAYTAGLTSYLAKVNPIGVPGGSTDLAVSSVVVNGAGVLSTVDLTATSHIGKDSARVVRSYSTHRITPSFVHVPGALTSYPMVDVNGNADVAGTTLVTPTNTGLLGSFMTVQNDAVVTLAAGNAVLLKVPDAGLEHLAQLRVGQYVQLPITGLPGMATFKVSAITGNTLSVQALPGTVGVTLGAGPFQLTNVLNGVVSSFGTQLTLNALESIYPGDQVSVSIGGVTYASSVTAVNGAVLTTAPWPAGMLMQIPEGTALIKSTNAVVTAGSYAGTINQTPVLGAVVDGGAGSALLSSPANDALFRQVFGMSPADYQTLSNVVPASTFDGTVSGLTWLDLQGASSANLNSQKVHGSGVLVVPGDLVINNNGSQCAFSGVLVVRGSLRMQGNMQSCGALFVEGAFISSNTTTIRGTGAKVTYDAGAILDSLRGGGPYTFGSVGTWRQL